VKPWFDKPEGFKYHRGFIVVGDFYIKIHLQRDLETIIMKHNMREINDALELA
jgi:hypothetical protein